MMRKELHSENVYALEELYEAWLEDPSSVAEDWQEYFQGLQNGAVTVRGITAELPNETIEVGCEDNFAYRQSRVDRLIWAYRDIGYLYANLNPLPGYLPPELKYSFYADAGPKDNLAIREFGLDESELDMTFSAGRFVKPNKQSLHQIIETFKGIYCGTLGVEFLHIQNRTVRNWLIDKIEKNNNKPQLSVEEKKTIYQDLMKAQEFEHFLHTQFVGQKRFSLEGGESLIPALHFLVNRAVENNANSIVFGMAHRGRLNVLANILKKPEALIFSEFSGSDVEPTWSLSGDVKYHMGFSLDLDFPGGKSVHLNLVSNPSHLESVDPVVEGKARGIQSRIGDRLRKHVLPVLIHGDSAFSGQGIVAETLNLSKLTGYKTGGTIHIIVNNQIGFTTASAASRSTYFSTSVAKSQAIPIFHVNGYDPEAVVWAVELALKYRQKFGSDAIIDIFCYRVHGHNEADEPTFTHPIMYKLIKESPGAMAHYGKKLEEQGILSKTEQEKMLSEYVAHLKQAVEEAKNYQGKDEEAFRDGEWKGFTRTFSFDTVKTAISASTFKKIGLGAVTVPKEIEIHSKLKRILTGRKKMIETGEGIDWATGEMLAYGSLLLDGTRIRLSGEDSGRGTFSQRHAVLWDRTAEKPKQYLPLNHIQPDQEQLYVYDSPLSEFSVLGFEYGHSLARPHVLTLWEAQFGDFANEAQVIIDQYISSTEAKWNRASGLVMLLPHGYEGQGPEHSNAYLERYLQLCAEENMQVCNLTTSAQYFHLLRRQMKVKYRKPLIIMTPKSMLRNPRAASKVDDFTRGAFQMIVDDSDHKKAKSLLLCSGKIYHDLDEYRGANNRSDIAIVRVEQLYPFHSELFSKILKGFSGLKQISWVQEEPKNRGAWSYIEPILREHVAKDIRYVGRKASASPATGHASEHKIEQASIIREAFND